MDRYFAAHTVGESLPFVNTSSAQPESPKASTKAGQLHMSNIYEVTSIW